MDSPTYEEYLKRVDTACRSREMVVTFITQDQDGFHTFTGHIVSRGPTSIVVLLTEPFAMAGRSVKFPISSVVEEKLISQ